jgi:hypothetical protein
MQACQSAMPCRQRCCHAPLLTRGRALSRLRSVRAVSDCEVVVLGRGHVQGVLAKDPAVRTEVQVVQERRRRELEASMPPRPGDSRARGSAGPLVLFCGLDRMVLDVGRGVEAWWVGVLSAWPWRHK